jgi:hypothetical protein
LGGTAGADEKTQCCLWPYTQKRIAFMSKVV